MGLDMYLTAKKFVSSYHEDGKKLSEKISKITDIHRQVKYIIYEAAYWRKCNQIHQWFVNNVQSGADDCERYYVEREQLEEIRDIVTDILSAFDVDSNIGIKKAMELLPTKGGFFFGSTDYDEYYIGDLQSTKDQLDSILNDATLESCEFEYHSSW